MSFNPQTLRTKLVTSTETADSITSTAQWILFYKRHAATVAQQWAEAVKNDENKLAEIYIANEVIQQSKNKKKAEFVSAFADVLPAALEAAYSQADLPTRDRIARVVKVWRERLIFTPETQNEIEAALNSHAGTPAVHADLKSLAKKYADLQAAVKKRSTNARDLVEEVLSELSTVRTKVEELESGLARPIKSPEIEPLSPAAANDVSSDTANRVADSVPQDAANNDEPETYTAKHAQASVTASQHDDDDVGYADSSEDEKSEQGADKTSSEGPPEKKPRVDLDPKLSSFLANISKSGM